MRTVYLWDIILHWAIDLWHFTGLNYPVMQHCVTEDQTSQTNYCENLQFQLEEKSLWHIFLISFITYIIK
jgi:hypothetical protein